MTLDQLCFGHCSHLGNKPAMEDLSLFSVNLICLCNRNNLKKKKEEEEKDKKKKRKEKRKTSLRASSPSESLGAYISAMIP